MARDTRLPIGGLAKRTGTKVNTIRFYEDIGLLPCAARTASGRRTYGDEDVGRLAFIRNARGLGFGAGAGLRRNPRACGASPARCR